jgi:hypothetical protein
MYQIFSLSFFLHAPLNFFACCTQIRTRSKRIAKDWITNIKLVRFSACKRFVWKELKSERISWRQFLVIHI